MEKHLEKKLRNRIKDKGGLCLKWVSPGISGVPDRIVLMPGGRVFFVEMKFGNGKLSPKQRLVGAMFEQLGIKIIVLKSAEEVDNFVNAL